jgi:hypothetical protein
MVEGEQGRGDGQSICERESKGAAAVGAAAQVVGTRNDASGGVQGSEQPLESEQRRGRHRWSWSIFGVPLEIAMPSCSICMFRNTYLL